MVMQYCFYIDFCFFHNGQVLLDGCAVRHELVNVTFFSS